MFASILEAVVAFLKAIPIFDRWFTKTAQEKEQEKRSDVDKEHQENAENPEGRPSGDFWNGRGT